MKRKIIIGLGAFTVAVMLPSLYIALAIRSSTNNLDRLITLHQVELLREQYLLQIKRVQAKLIHGEPHETQDVEGVVASAGRMGELLDTCFQCHHSPLAARRLKSLKTRTAQYSDALSRVLAVRSDSGNPSAEEEAAFRSGEDLIAEARDMIDVTTASLERSTHLMLSDIASAKYVLYALVVLGPLLSVLLGFIFISGLTRPLDVLLESTRKLKGGALGHRVADLKDEFGELAGAFNEMASSLKEQMQSARRNEQMVVVGQLAAGLAHEIKNPLGGIKAAMQVLAEEASLSQEDRKVVKRVAQEVVRLESLMKNFLNFAKPAKPQLARLNVNHIIHAVVGLSIPGERSTAVRIVKQLRPIPETMADPMQLQQVLLNLILNAVDSMPQGGTLSLRTACEPGSILVEIADTGRGISAEHIDQIFQPFFTTKPKGTGLGLAISKKLVEQHGGSIAVAGNPAGGTVFQVRLPVVATTELCA